MQIVHARQPFPRSFTRALFLAGPTPRSPDVPSWRPRALELLAERGYDGAVFVPEDADGSPRFDYLDQVEWEEAGLHLADAIVFWIPRDLDALPGFTTNVEWGVWHDSGKAVLGAPPGAPKLAYLRRYARKLHVPQADTLAGALDAALQLAGEGVLREGGEREVPLFIWREPAFQQWYAAQRGAGHRLDGARLHWHFRSGPGRHLFCWALQVKVFIPGEGRHKGGEVILSRPDVSSVLAYRPAARVADCEIVLVREFRSNAATPDGFVHELPGAPPSARRRASAPWPRASWRRRPASRSRRSGSSRMARASAWPRSSRTAPPCSPSRSPRRRWPYSGHVRAGASARTTPSAPTSRSAPSPRSWPRTTSTGPTSA